MKKGKQIDIKLDFSVRTFFIFITVGILAIGGIGVYAATYSASGAGHPYSEITTCAEGQFLEVIGGVWTCATYPTTTANCQWIQVTGEFSPFGGNDDEGTRCPKGKVLMGIEESTGYIDDDNPSTNNQAVDVVNQILCC